MGEIIIGLLFVAAFFGCVSTGLSLYNYSELTLKDSEGNIVQDIKMKKWKVLAINAIVPILIIIIIVLLAI